MKERSPRFRTRESFIEQAPIGTWIWRGRVNPEEKPIEFGQTMPGQVYEDPQNPYVNVRHINNTPGWSGVWFWADATSV